MRQILIFIFCTVAVSALGQRYNVTGTLLDSLSRPLPSATILLLSQKDSSLVNFAVSNNEGVFIMRNVSGDNFVKVTFLGFRTFTRKIVPVADSEVNLGEVRLEPVANELEAIEIAADRAPVTVKRDTIEFNASSFKTTPNAVVEDLLKKLPGVEVDNDGNITSQGEQVRRVTVDGKNFFGTDPKLATRNLPADAVDKVQVFDKKSDQAAFTGIDDGQREKTINLELKEEKRNGMFGSIMAGGTDERYQAKVSLNKFTRKRQLSFLGMGNNVNDQGFSMEEYMNFSGGSQQMMRGGAVRLEFSGENQNGVPLNFGNRANGIMSTLGTGVNLNNELGNKGDINGSYFFNYIDHDKDQSIFRENFLGDSSYLYKENSSQRALNYNHRANGTVDYRLDSMNSLKLTTSLTVNDTESRSASFGETILRDGEFQNSSSRYNFQQGSSTAMNSSLLWRHKFGKKGRTLSTTAGYSVSANDRTGLLNSVNTGRGGRELVIDQENFQETGNHTLSAATSYTEPLGKRRYLEGNYSFRQHISDVNRDVFDLNQGEKIFNNSLSNEFTSDYQYHQGGINFRISRKKMNLVVGTSVQQTSLLGELTSHDHEISKSFTNMLPVVRFNYDFTDTRHLRLDYETSVQQPGIQQLQPIVDNTDPLNIYEGNPALRPAYVQRWRTNFMNFNPATFVSFFVFADVDYTTNAIVNSQSVDERFIRTTKPVNIARSVRANADANVSFPVTELGSRFSLGVNQRHEKTAALLNDITNEITQQTAGFNVRYTYRYKEIFELNLSADVDRQQTNYQYGQAEQTFYNKTFEAGHNLTFLKNYQLTSDFQYLMYRNSSTGFSQSLPLLDLAVSRFMLKNKAGELKLSVTNLLDRALGVNQTASLNYIERQITNSLGRYFMLSFTYALNRQLNPMGMRRGGAMMRVIR